MNKGTTSSSRLIYATAPMQIGAIVARDSLEGLDVEVLVASQFWGQGVADEAGEPVMEWLADNNEVNLALQ